MVVLLLVGVFSPLMVEAQTVQNKQPVALGMFVVPPTLPADGRSYPALVVSLLDGHNLPTLSLADVVVYLSSSNQSVASIPSIVTMPAGHAYLQIPVNTTTSTGQAVLAGASSGLSSNSVNLKTMKPGNGPESLSLFVAPPRSLQSLVGDDVVFAVQLANAIGRPAVSTAATGLIITSSNSSLVSRPIEVMILAGSNLAYGEVKVLASGAATLTALSPQLATGSADLNVARVAKTLTLSVTPPVMSVGATASVLVSAQILGMPVPGLNVTLTTYLGTIVPTRVTTNANGQGTAKYLARAPGPATITAVASASYLGVVNGSTTAIVTAATVTTPSSDATGMFLFYIPIIVAVVVLVLAFVVIRVTVRKRKGTPEEDFPVAEPKP
jgi:hypothetical protein